MISEGSCETADSSNESQKFRNKLTLMDSNMDIKIMVVCVIIQSKLL